jgi:hypothetical protein
MRLTVVRFGRKLKLIWTHEDNCEYGVFRCPAFYTGKCAWLGSQKAMLLHLNIGCVQILHNQEKEFSYCSHISDVQNGEPSVLTQNIPVYWKPVVMMSKSPRGFMLYMLLARRPEGEFVLHFRAITPLTAEGRIRVEMEITSTETYEDSRQHSLGVKFKCDPVSSFFTNAEALATGNYMVLTDSQVKNFQSARALFQYKVTIIDRTEEAAQNPLAPPANQEQAQEPIPNEQAVFAIQADIVPRCDQAARE